MPFNSKIIQEKGVELIEKARKILNLTKIGNKNLWKFNGETISLRVKLNPTGPIRINPKIADKTKTLIVVIENNNELEFYKLNTEQFVFSTLNIKTRGKLYNGITEEEFLETRQKIEIH
jgi:hypothetical protein